MAKILRIAVVAPPPTIEVAVDFYDGIHRQALLQSAASSVMQSANLPGNLTIATADLLAYYLFYKKRPGTRGYSSYGEVSSKCHHALIELDGLVDFRNGSLGVVSSAGMNTGTSERLGEAIGLAVISKLHNLVDADWAKIEETNKRKTLDFEYAASDGKLLIRTEAKGSATTNNGIKCSSVSHHKSSVEQKKVAERNATGGQSSAILYGTIAVLDDRQNSLAQCWLLDPLLNLETSPGQFRVISRLSSIADLLSFISPRSAITIALQNRVKALKSIGNIGELDKAFLVKGDGEEFDSRSLNGFGERNPWFWNKSYVIDGPAGGQVLLLSDSSVLFIGILEELLLLAMGQSFSRVSEFRYTAGSVKKTVRCVVPVGRFQREFSSALDGRIRVNQQGGYTSFDLGGNLHYSSGGLVFGILPIEEQIGV